MLKIPKQTKRKKLQKKIIKNIVRNSTLYSNPSILRLVSLESFHITPNQINSMKQTLEKQVKRTCQVRIRIFPHTPITKKPLEVRMGKGKGSVDGWVSKVSAGTTIFDVENASLSLNLLMPFVNKVQMKLPVKTKILKIKML